MGFLAPGQRPIPPGFTIASSTREATLLERPWILGLGPPTESQVSEAICRVAAHQRRHLLPPNPNGSSMSFLEQTAVKETTLRDYRMRLTELLEWRRRRNFDWKKD